MIFSIVLFFWYSRSFGKIVGFRSKKIPVLQLLVAAIEEVGM